MNAPTLESKLTLAAFLKQPETKPASEFINGEIIQKPMPQGEHTLIQIELCKAIDQVVQPQKIAKAFPELRCTFGGVSIVPDISVFRWQRIPTQPSGRIVNRFEIQPDWAIEILSPNQNSTKVLRNLLPCSQHGTELGWLIAPEDETVFAVFPGQRVEVFEGTASLPMIEGVDLALTVEQILSWLTFSQTSNCSLSSFIFDGWRVALASCL
ncbi:Uma2 family endonuclease [Phormidesmis priestleyi ULC007]|uniref:Uma2 family endonuclease n=1 Tax=Phormidesmis priestleyi ULC007 TaxID=1920490 RepID=A0A2T1DJY7_9CYAN|nr:Uma2 family endonuclease [Phormidesmis priestleyi]PSB20818.1 Uma2 family endonuclease [Phormidesmis priestleyi ULC007]PZO51773.1 MAG: Uma2 family endonuclease [Phormidesmis priestleyi]